jgi:hypothetical protein
MICLLIEKFCRLGTSERSMIRLELFMLLRASVCRMGKLLLKELRGVLEMVSSVRLFRMTLLRSVTLESSSSKVMRLFICIERVFR